MQLLKGIFILMVAHTGNTGCVIFVVPPCM